MPRERTMVSHSVPPNGSLEPGQRVGRYRVVRRVARGGQGGVYEVAEESTGQRLALKVLAAGPSPALARLLRAELEHLAAVQHPSLAAVHEVLVEPGRQACLVTELVEGLPWLEAIAAAGPPGSAARRLRAVELGLPLLSALQRLHAAGLCHLDVKPDNLLVAGDRPVLLDLGCVARAGAVAARGTAAYAAPEVTWGEPLDRRADLYSFARTLVEAIGAGPDEAGERPALAEELGRMLAPDPAHRPGSASEAAARLAAAVGLPPPAAEPEPLPGLEGAEDRAEELARLVASWEEGGARVVLLSGPPGSGRSRLLRAGRWAARAAGLEVGSVPFAEPGAERSYGRLGPLLQRWRVPILGAQLAAGCDEGLGRARVHVAAVEALRRAKNGSGLVLAVDDLEAAPEEALGVVVALARSLLAPGPRGTRAALWVIGPSGEPGRPELARALAELRERGALELRLESRGGQPGPLALPEGGAGSHGRALLDALAVAGGALPVDVAAQMVGHPALDDVARLTARGLLRREADELRLATGRVAARLQAELAPSIRRALARRGLGIPGLPLALQARWSVLAGDAALAAPTLLEAAREALAAGAPHAARGWLEALIAARPPAPRLHAAQALLARVESLTGARESALARRRQLLADAGAPAAERLEAGLAAAESLAGRPGASAEVEALLGQVEALLPPAGSPDVACRVERVRATLLVHGDPAAAEETCRRTLERLRCLASPGSLASLELVHGIALFTLERLTEAEAALERARSAALAGRADRTAAMAAMNLSLCHQKAGRLEESARAVRAAREAFRLAGDLRGLAIVDADDGVRLVQLGAFRPALSLLESALGTFEGLGERERVAQLRAHVGVARARLGDTAGAARELALALERFLALGHPAGIAFALGELTRLAVEQDDPVAAIDCLERQAAHLDRLEPKARVETLATRALALARCGREAEARTAAEQAFASARQVGAGPIAVARAWLAKAELSLARGDAAAAETAARTALQGAPADRPEAQSVLAVAQAQLGRRSEAVAGLEERERLSREDAVGLLVLRLARASLAEDRAERLRELLLVHSAAGIGGLRRLARMADEAVRQAKSDEHEVVLELIGLAGAAGPRPQPGGGLLSRVLAAGHDPAHMLDLAIGLLIESIGAERGLLVLLDAAGRPVETAARNIRDADLVAPVFEYSRRLVEAVARTREAVLVVDALSDPRWAGSDSVADLAIRSVLALPIIDPDGARPEEVLAVLYLDDRTGAGRFGAEELALARRLARELAPALELARDRAREAAAADEGAPEPPAGWSATAMVGTSAAMQALQRLVARAARNALPVLIEGESGTGKELVARAVHAAGSRSAGPFVPISCAAINDDLVKSELFGHVKGGFTGAVGDHVGLLEAASSGTLFLDDVASMSRAMQAALLRVLEDGRIRPIGAVESRRVSPRILASSSRPLEELVQCGQFRSDLYYRLAVMRIAVPPLRERKDDIPLLVDHFLRRAAAATGRAQPLISPAALKSLSAHEWRGNVRELENEVQRLVALGVGRILSRHLTGEARSGLSTGAEPLDQATLPEAIEALEREMISSTLRRTRGNVALAARLLQVERTKLIRRIAVYGLSPRRRSERRARA